MNCLLFVCLQVDMGIHEVVCFGWAEGKGQTRKLSSCLLGSALAATIVRDTRQCVCLQEISAFRVDGIEIFTGPQENLILPSKRLLLPTCP